MCVQTVIWEDYTLAAGVNAIQLQHDLETDDEGRAPPDVQELQIGGKRFDFPSKGWQDSSLILAANQLHQVDMTLTLAFNDDDSTTDQLVLRLQQRGGVTLTDCYSKEAMQVRTSRAHAVSACLHTARAFS